MGMHHERRYVRFHSPAHACMRVPHTSRTDSIKRYSHKMNLFFHFNLHRPPPAAAMRANQPLHCGRRVTDAPALLSPRRAHNIYVAASDFCQPSLPRRRRDCVTFLPSQSCAAPCTRRKPHAEAPAGVRPLQTTSLPRCRRVGHSGRPVGASRRAPVCCSAPCGYISHSSNEPAGAATSCASRVPLDDRASLGFNLPWCPCRWALLHFGGTSTKPCGQPDSVPRATFKGSD
jgi:hypothetical protein